MTALPRCEVSASRSLGRGVVRVPDDPIESRLPRDLERRYEVADE